LKYPRSMIPFDMLYFYLDENLREGLFAIILTHLLIAGGSCGRSDGVAKARGQGSAVC